MAKAYKLTRQQAAVWHRRIERAYRARQDTANLWVLLREYYRGNYFSDQIRQDRVTVNLLLATIRQTASALYFQNPNIFCKPLSPKGEIAAPIAEQLLAIELRTNDADSQYRDGIFNGLLYGVGILKHGYSFQYGQTTPTAAKISDRTGEGDGGFADDKIVYEAAYTERDPSVHFGHTWIRSIEPWHYLCDPDVTRQQDARWECHIFERPWCDCVADTRWDKTVREQIQPSGRSKWYTGGMSDIDWRTDAEAVDSSMVSCAEIYDRENQRIITLVDSLDDPVMVAPYPFFNEDGPYEILTFLRDDTSPIGMSYADTFADQCVAINKLRTSMFDHLMRNSGTKLAFNENAGITEDQIRAWANAIIGVVGLKGIGTETDIRNILASFPQVPINADAYKLGEIFVEDHRNVSGVSEIAMGAGTGGTATEASLIQQQAGLRIGDMRYLSERWIRRSAKRIMKLLAQFWTGEQVVALIGPDGRAFDYIRVDKELLAAEYDVDIESGSTERVDKAVRARQTIDAMAQLTPIVPFLNAQGYDINWPELVRQYIRNTDITRTPEKIIIQLPPPQPQPQQQPMMGQGQPGQGSPQEQAPGQPQGGNVVPFPAQMANQIQSQTPAPTTVNQMGQMPTETGPFQTGRMFSQANFARGT